MHADVAEWSKALVSGTSFFGSAGSNPAVRMFFLFAFVVRGPRRRFFVFGSVFRALRRHPGRPPGVMAAVGTRQAPDSPGPRPVARL